MNVTVTCFALVLRCGLVVAHDFLFFFYSFFFFFQAEDGIRDLVRSRGLGDVYKRQVIRLQIASL